MIGRVESTLRYFLLRQRCSSKIPHIAPL
jgi:hypothetical protein